MIGPASPADSGALRALWDACFPGDEAYSRLFFAERFAPDRTLVARQDGTPVSALHLLPAFVCVEGAPLPAYYIYAAATLPAFRGRGLMRRLLARAEELALARGARWLLLVPGEPSLFGFYGAQGYRPAFGRRLATITAEDAEPPAEGSARFFKAGGDFLAEAMRLYLPPRPFAACWDAAAARYAARDLRAGGGALLGFSRQGRPGCAAVIAWDDGTALVRELLCAPQDAAWAASCLRARLHAERLTLRLAPDTPGFPNGRLVPHGMLKPLGGAPMPPEDRGAFLPFALD